MPLQKLQLANGVNRENTRYASEGKWYESDKVRFRQGTPEKIGGWQRVSLDTYLGVCRALWNWTALNSIRYIAVGTNLKYYVYAGGVYYDVTPIRTTVALPASPFTTHAGTTEVTVLDVTGGWEIGDFVTFSGAIAVGGITLDGEYQISSATVADSYTVFASSVASASVTGGGASVIAEYQINTGPATQSAITGWGAGPWGAGPWGTGVSSTDPLRIWSQCNFGEDLIFGPRYGALYYWDTSVGTDTRAVALTSMGGASDVPVVQQTVLVSDASRFVIVFGTNELGDTTLDPMLIRWSDQESAVDWTPVVTNQAGSIRLSQGSEIVSALQMRQEILVWTDRAVYSMQYVGPPAVWSTTLLADNVTCLSPRCQAIASGVVYWMGSGKFFMYNGTVATLKCDLRKYIFDDINLGELYQIFSGTNEAFNEVWWFYCSSGSTVVDRYVVFNYAEQVWYYGTLGRTAWLDAASDGSPVAATYSYNLVEHEVGVDDNETGTPTAISAYVTSSEFDIGEGDQFSFIWRVLPDIDFTGSTASAPVATITLYPMKNSGSGYTVPASVAGTNIGTVTGEIVLPVGQFTGQVYTRVRGRQMAVKVASDTLGTAWQLGHPRIDIRPDGAR